MFEYVYIIQKILSFVNQYNNKFRDYQDEKHFQDYESGHPGNIIKYV